MLNEDEVLPNNYEAKVLSALDQDLAEITAKHCYHWMIIANFPHVSEDEILGPLTNAIAAAIQTALWRAKHPADAA